MLAQVMFLTINNAGEIRSYGSFGTSGEDPFIFNGNIVGLAGAVYNNKDGVGVHRKLFRWVFCAQRALFKCMPLFRSLPMGLHTINSSLLYKRYIVTCCLWNVILVTDT